MRHFIRDRRGQATVELAVTLPIFLLLILGVIYFGKAFYKEQQVQIASRYVCWKAGRHSDQNLSQASSRATQNFSLQGSTINGSGQNGTVEDLSDFGSGLFDGGGFGDPGILPSFFNFNVNGIAVMLGTGIAQVDTRYTATVDLPMGTQMMGGVIEPYNIEREHHVAIGHWDYDEIEGGVVIAAYEAYLDAWAFDEIYGLL